MGPLVAFWVLFLHTLTTRAGRAGVYARLPAEWALDLLGLLVQGTVVPWLGVLVGAVLWARILPGGLVDVGWLGGFLLNFVLVDYLYYWNHRLLHVWWPVHQVHHTARAMDVLVTSRNTLWASLFIVYVWVHGLFVHLLVDPSGYVFGVAATACLDLWRHSGAQVSVPGLIQPRDHAWHHSLDRANVNYGANWTWWDRLHGTFHRPGPLPVTLGIPTGLSWARTFWWPFPRAAS